MDRLRREPFRLFFAEAVVLLWAGVLHWFLLGIGVLEGYRSIFHALAQVQGFMTCFALGFLFTFVPRRTGTEPPAAWRLLLAAACPAGLVVLAWQEQWALSQVCWLLLVAVLLPFLLSAWRRAGGRMPGPFVWLPLSFGLSIVAGALTGIGTRSDELMWVHDIGRRAILQGLFAGLISGVGSVVLPPFLQGRPPPQTRARWHLLLAAALWLSFWLEAGISFELGYLVRAAVPGTALAMAGLHRPPTLPGLHRRLMWLACWLMPAGFLLVALFPGHARAGQHVVFIGSFALLAFSVSLHVLLSHGGRGEELAGAPRFLRAFVALAALGLAFRILVELDPVRFFPWLAGASASLLLASLAWAAVVLWRPGKRPGWPAIGPRPPPKSAGG